MAFQVKDFLSIVASMVNHIRGATDKLTDFNVGSVNRSMIEASAVEIDELYQQMLNGLRDAIPAATYLSFGFSKLPSASASVTVTFTVSPVSADPITIAAGSKVKVPGSAVTYLTDSEVIIASGGASGSVRVVADTPGVVGNTLAGTITEMVAPITDVTVTNALAAINGRDEESDSVRAVRFAEYIQSLSRAPILSVGFGALTASILDVSGNITEYVAKAKVVEPYATDNAQPLGYIDCYIYNGSGGTSAALKTETQKIIDGYLDQSGKRVMGWKAAGIVCVVKLVTEQAQNVTAVLTIDNGYTLSDLASEVNSRITAYIQNLDIGVVCVRNELIGIAMTVDGVYNVNLSVPAADVSPGANIKLIPGTIAIS